MSIGSIRQVLLPNADAVHISCLLPANFTPPSDDSRYTHLIACWPSRSWVAAFLARCSYPQSAVRVSVSTPSHHFTF